MLPEVCLYSFAYAQIRQNKHLKKRKRRKKRGLGARAPHYILVVVVNNEELIEDRLTRWQELHIQILIKI